MDLVADMLLAEFAKLSCQAIESFRIQPTFQRVATRFLAVRNGTVWNADRLINRTIFYSSYAKNLCGLFDAYHVIDHSYAHLISRLPHGRVVVTCHDLDAFRSLLDPAAEPRPAWFRALTRRILAGLQRATHVVFGSQTVREEALRYQLVRPEITSVVHNGVHPSCTAKPVLVSDCRASELLPFPHQTPLLLHVGSTVSRKRIDSLLRIFRAIHREFPAKLIRIGGAFTAEQSDLAKGLGIHADVVQLPFLERDTLAAVYRRCDLLLITSEREGFGLPVAEAMACGCPVVASDLRVLREVGGSAAEFVPLGNEAAWRNVILSLLAEKQAQPLAWRERREACIQNASRFTWHNAARDYLSIYQSLL